MPKEVSAEFSTYETILVDRGDGLARLTLNRPEHRNAMTNQMVRETTQALRHIAADPTVRVLVITGAGESFCPGADLNHFTSGAVDERLDPGDFAAASLLHSMSAVTVAAINGACAGAGLGWALACDFRVMTESAKCNTAFLDVAVAGDMGIPWSLPRLVGGAKARELSFFPRRITAAEALELSLVTAMFADETFPAETEAFIESLLARSPAALRGMKEHYVIAERMGFEDFIAYESERHLRIAASPHTAEAFRAFIEKRKPRFT